MAIFSALLPVKRRNFYPYIVALSKQILVTWDRYKCFVQVVSILVIKLSSGVLQVFYLLFVPVSKAPRLSEELI